MTKTFNVTPRAKADLRGIWNYIFDHWSEAQADKYVGELYERFAWLADRPRIGRHRADV
ncbi:MAG: type II toxin-antitoxin system RelE/ParE family toxin [Exilibacterium sp.]